MLEGPDEETLAAPRPVPVDDDLDRAPTGEGLHAGGWEGSGKLES
jgi:hypothetical protein